MDFRHWMETVRIDDPDALDKMAEIEGENWKKLQEQRPESAYGFHAYLNGWKEIEAEGLVGEVSPREAVPGGDGAIYGEGGYSRYSVNSKGEIVLLKWSARPEKIEKAMQLGFTVA